MSRAPTSTVALPVVSALSSGAWSLEHNLQQIFKIVLDFRPPTPPLAPAPAFQQYKSAYERPLNARFPDVYWDKTYLDCYNFFQQCKDHFATARAKSQNQVLFIATFFTDIALFCWQQY